MWIIDAQNCLKLWAGIVFGLLMPLMPLAGNAENLPDGLSVIGLSEGQWKVYVAKENKLEAIEGIESPRTASYHHGKSLLAYISVDGRLMLNRLASNATQELVSVHDNSRFTQPNISVDGRWVYAVELPEGKSRRTNIVGFDMDTDTQHGIVRKRTAQFEPFSDANGYLYYTTAICVDDCEGMIWELWRRNLIDGKQEQLTLLNALSSQPHISEDGWLYFTSNVDSGRFHIWRMLPKVNAIAQQLTRGNFRDSDPATSSDGSVFFIRKSAEGVSLVRWTNNTLTTIATPGLEDLRNLELGR